jgi:hypothetical protein
MKLNNHERAKKLLCADRAEGIPAADRAWLEAHLTGCAECSKESTSLAFAIDSLALLSGTATPDVVRRTTLAVRRRAEELRINRKQALPLWIAVGASSLWTMLTAPYVWSGFSWAGRLLHLSDPIWQLAFLMWWFWPCAVLSAVAFKREIAIIPGWLFIVAALIFVGIPVSFFLWVWPRQPGPPPLLFQILITLVLATVLGFYALMVAYVNLDAARRGMSRTLWTLLVIFIPNAIGFILYFLLRPPVRLNCPNCGALVDPRANYCPHCRHSFHPTCPQCKTTVQPGDVFCTHCGLQLSNNEPTI